jgi:anhydro-N-acetylmuramic acid kinase
MQEFYRVIGLMSGSSLDGLDMACCEFTHKDGKWSFAIQQAECAAYDRTWTDRLRGAHELSGRDLWQLHADFGHFCGSAVKDFIARHRLADVTLVASHGHTVFHYPKQGFTTQIGDGAALAAGCGLPIVYDFRSTDVAKGGQGAPLVPMGDKLLFSDYAFLLNIGGIANLTAQGERTIAFDICSANQVLNHYAQQKGLEYDRDGALAAKGKLDQALFDKLNGLAFYNLPAPKSLGNEYSRDTVLPLIEQSGFSVEDKLHTFCAHIAHQIALHIKKISPGANDRLLATGGGALNGFLIQLLKEKSPVAIDVPDAKTVQYKEALVFALLGLLRWRNETNTLASVTGASGDSISGAIYLP